MLRGADHLTGIRRSETMRHQNCRTPACRSDVRLEADRLAVTIQMTGNGRDRPPPDGAPTSNWWTYERAHHPLKGGEIQ